MCGKFYLENNFSLKRSLLQCKIDGDLTIIFSCKFESSGIESKLQCLI